jgi:hypothetical protein
MKTNTNKKFKNASCFRLNAISVIMRSNPSQLQTQTQTQTQFVGIYLGRKRYVVIREQAIALAPLGTTASGLQGHNRPVAT